MSSENVHFLDEGFSPPLEGALRRADSNMSWKPSSQGSTKEEKQSLDKSQLFLVSLQALIALFT